VDDLKNIKKIKHHGYQVSISRAGKNHTCFFGFSTYGDNALEAAKAYRDVLLQGLEPPTRGLYSKPTYGVKGFKVVEVQGPYGPTILFLVKLTNNEGDNRVTRIAVESRGFDEAIKEAGKALCDLNGVSRNQWKSYADIISFRAKEKYEQFLNKRKLK